jgi:hypothetical protein
MVRRRRSLVLLVLLLIPALTFAVSARADWPANGRALCTTPGTVFFPMIAPDGTGGAIVGWGDFRLSTFGTYSARVLRNGFLASGWPADGAMLGGSLTTYSLGRGVSDGAGGAYFAWGGDDASSVHRIILQHVTGAGQRVANWPVDGLVVGDAPPKGLPRLASDGAGGALVSWIDAGALIRLQRVLSDGTRSPGWPASGALVTNVAGTYGVPSVVGDGSGGGIVEWTDNGVGSGDVRAQHIDSGGSLVSGWAANGNVVCGASGLQNARQPLADGAGGAWILWADDRDAGTNGRDIYVQRITGSGALVSGWPVDGIPVCNAVGEQSQPNIVSDDAGGVYVEWLDKRTAADGDPYIQHLTADGTPATGWVANGKAVSTASGGEQLSQDPIAGDGNGGVIVVWSDARDSLTTARDVYAQRFDSNGSVHGGWTSNGAVLCAAAGDQTDVHCVSDGSGGAIVAWTDDRSGDPNDFDIYAIGIRSDGTTPAQLAMVSAEATIDRVTLEWYAPEDLPGTTYIERRAGDRPWTVIATAERDGLGHLRYEDRDVVPGNRYGYRLSDVHGAITAETWVDVPAASLALVSAVPDRDGELRVRFSLMSGGAATLQLFDVAGRCVRAESALERGPGVHETRLPGRLASGVYWLRLGQDGASVRRKVLVAH